VRRYFREMRHLPRPFFKSGLLVQDVEQTDDGVTGRILPRIWLAGFGGPHLAVDNAVGQGFGLIGLHIERAALDAAADHPLWRLLRPTLLLVEDESSTDPDERSLRVIGEQGRALFAAHRGKILVLRPDRYVAGAAIPERFRALSDRLEERLGSQSAESGPDGGIGSLSRPIIAGTGS
jgi:3-(3-hydroxy-phenyl)propionate hydroxylase